MVSYSRLIQAAHCVRTRVNETLVCDFHSVALALQSRRILLVAEASGTNVIYAGLTGGGRLRYRDRPVTDLAAGWR